LRVRDGLLSALAALKDVTVFAADAQIDEPFEGIGQIYYDDAGPFQILGVDSAMKLLKQRARAIGADGLILGRSEPVELGIVSRESTSRHWPFAD
jgi:hypothetical protein